MRINPVTKTLTVGAIALAALAPAGIAQACKRPQVEFSGRGTYQTDTSGTFASGTGSGRGRPFDGNVTFMLRADDGTLPAPGECEPGGANLAVRARKRDSLSAVSIGEICGLHVQPPTSTATHAFTGEYSIFESTTRLRDTEGWIEIRLATGNQMSITLVDS